MIRKIALALLLVPSLALATTPVSKTLDQIKATGGSALSVPSTGASIVAADSNSNISGNSFAPSYRTTATSGVSDTLTVASPALEYYTGSSAENCILPVVSTLPKTGFSYTIVNLSSGSLTVESSGANTIQVMAQNTQLVVTAILLTGTGTASWNAVYSMLQPGANTALSNLTTTSINQSLLPSTTNSINLGSPTDIWGSVYSTGMAESATSPSISIGSSTGLLKDTAGVTSVSWAGRALDDSGGSDQLDWSTSGVRFFTTVSANHFVVTNSSAFTTQLAFGAVGTILAGAGTSTLPTNSATPTLGGNASFAGTLGLANGNTSGATVTLTNPAATTAYNFVLPSTVGAAGSFLTSQAGGTTPMTWTTTIPTTAGGNGTWQQDIFRNCNGSTTAFTLSFTPAYSTGLVAHLDGSLLAQGSGNDYTTSGTTLTLASACSTGQRLIVVYQH